jgi:fructokinase
MARRAGIPVSFDPNLRISFWASDETLKEQTLRLWQIADVIKVSEEELFFLAGRAERRDAVHRLWHDRLRLLAVTLGPDGAEVYTPQGSAHVPSLPVTAVDTTGAGDGFVAGLWSCLVGKTHVSLEEAVEACRRANVVGGLTTTKRGAINALPWLADLPSSADS